MEDIMRLATSEAMLFKYGSGTGSDLSSLRARARKLSGGGKPSGPLSFLKVYDQVANVVKSGGKTRRAAKMNTLKDWHPGHRRVHRRETEGREESVGADRAGIRRQLQRRRLRLGHVSE
jgi:ribonucleotide reductase alpha subunit